METSKHTVVIFDGHCILCNGMIDVLLRIDRKRNLRYAAMQSEFASRYHIDGVDSIVVLDHEKVYIRSEAVFKIIKELPWFWQWMMILNVLPKRCNDAVYQWVARNRYGWFGRKDNCRLPTEEEKQWFLG